VNLLIQPSQISDEGIIGYRFRLANANLLSVRQLDQLEMTGEVDSIPASSIGAGLESTTFSPWVKRWSRFCSHCLPIRKSWQIGWEVLFADACSECGHWLIDSCSRCGERIQWHRYQLLQCDCGHNLIMEQVSNAPEAVIQLSCALKDIAMGYESKNIPIFNGLSLAQCSRLIRLVGTYGNNVGASVPQKVLNIDTLSVSWPITSMAAEVLTNWPTAFSLLLKAISDSSNNKSNGKLTTTFGGLYTALYKGFKDAEFEFLRTAFENYLTEHWTGALGKRNRRLNDRLLNSVAWIPANHACQLLSVSRRRLLDLIQEGRLRGEMRLSSKNRQFIVVMRVDVEGLVSTLDDGISLMEAASALGLTKQRLLNLLPIIYPGAKKLGVQGCPWSIPRTWIAQWEHLICSQRSIEHADSTQVELKYLLRYWPWTNAQVGKLINDIFSGTICPIGTLESNQGISALIFDKTQLNKWFIYQSAVPCEELTLPEAAVRMGVKQEVIYSLVRSALLQTTLRRTGRRAEQRVKFTQLEAFENQYVFGRDIAKTFGCSPRKVAALLEQSNVKPVAGPRNNNCRQLVFIRAEIDDWLSHKALTP
jgi:hypothetical protein